jgi:acyl-CoA hydrolase
MRNPRAARQFARLRSAESRSDNGAMSFDADAIPHRDERLRHVQDRDVAVSRRGWLACAAFAAGLLALAGCSRRAPAANASAVPSGATVLALGDSLTQGVGADPAASYPALLAGLTGWKVINGGVAGDTSAQALQRLPGLLAEHRPALMIVGIGGNDFLRRLSAEETENNLRRSVAFAREAGAQVLIVAVPQPTLGAAIGAAAGVASALADHPLYETVARDLGVPLHAGGWARVLADARLRADQIHANADGYRVFTEGLVDSLRRSGLLEGR